MKRVLFIFLIVFGFSNIISGQYTVETVPNPNKNGWFVSNPDAILYQTTVKKLNADIKTAHDNEIVQVAVVALNSIGDEIPKDFAHQLLNKWGVGDAASNNGLVILLVLDQRTVAFATGYGIEQSLTDADCYNIQQEYMVPYFKKGDYDTGILEGTLKCIEFLKNYDFEDNENSDALFYFIVYGILLTYLAILLSVILKFFKTLESIKKEDDLHEKYVMLRPFGPGALTFIFPFPFVFITIYSIIKMKKWRNTPRVSSTGKIMHRLSEEEDDAFLDDGRVTEEQLRSIDYDVWITDDGDEVLVLDYKRMFSKYKKCPKCNYHTYYMKENVVLERATTQNSGSGEKRYLCKYCGHTYTDLYIIPQKTESPSSSSGSSWGGGSSGSGGASSSW